MAPFLNLKKFKKRSTTLPCLRMHTQIPECALCQDWKRGLGQSFAWEIQLLEMALNEGSLSFLEFVGKFV